MEETKIEVARDMILFSTCIIMIFIFGGLIGSVFFSNDELDSYDRYLLLEEATLYKSSWSSNNRRLNILRYEYDVHCQMIITSDSSLQMESHVTQMYDKLYDASDFEANSMLILYDVEQRRGLVKVGENLEAIFMTDNEEIFEIIVPKKTEVGYEISNLISVLEKKLEFYYG